MLQIKILSMLSDPATGFINQIQYEAKGNTGQSVGVVGFENSEIKTPFSEVTLAMAEQWVKESGLLNAAQLDDPSKDAFNTTLPWETAGA
jgi:hypothetical protein